MPTNNPLVSIIIPTYNRAHLIGETLDSVLAQTYQNWECLIVDDGSTDTTESIIANYSQKDSRFQYFSRPSDKPKGANACRNYGFEKSKGEYTQWFDSDDLMHPEKLGIKITYALSQNADIIVDTHTTENRIILINKPKLEVFKSNTYYVDYILGRKQIITNDVMVKYSVIGTLRYDENLHKAQEYEFYTRLFEKNLTYCFIDLALTIYREGHDSISKNMFKNNGKQVESLIYLSKLIINRYSDNPNIIARAERQGRKTYKSLILRRKLKLIFKNFTFFRNSHHKSPTVFTLFIIYNYITKSGFDVIKPKIKGQA